MLLQATHLTKSYGPHIVVDDVSLTLLRGETLGLVGESGSGKSTIARLLLRLIEPTSGRILYYPPTPGNSVAPNPPPQTAAITAAAATAPNHPPPIDLLRIAPRDLRRLRRHIAIVFQDPYAALNPRMSVRQILTEPFRIHREVPTLADPSLADPILAAAGETLPSARHAPSRAVRQAALTARLHQLLAEVHLDPAALTRYPHEFSGGQRQRLNIARALALRPSLLILDEPVSALDTSVAAQIVNLLRDLQSRHHLTCLFISHSMPLVRYLCHRVAVLHRGRLVETGPANQLCAHPTHPYTQQLLAATPTLPTLT